MMIHLNINPILFISLVLASTGLSYTEGLAQSKPQGEGVVHLIHWPSALYEEEVEDAEIEAYSVLPFIDSLSLDYSYEVRDAAPVLAFSLAWRPGPWGVYEGKRVPYEAMPGDIRIVAIDMQATVHVEGEPVGTLFLSVDSLLLAPSPDRARIAVEELAWEEVFEGVEAVAARRYFEEGFELTALKVERVLFAVYGQQTRVRAERAGRVLFDPYHPVDVCVYPARVGIYVDWIIPPRRYRADAVARSTPRRARRPRVGGREADPSVDRTARGGRTRSGDRGDVVEEGEAASEEDASRSSGRRKASSSDEDDEDDEGSSLLPEALVGVAAVGAVALIGGTVGYYGNMAEAPLGLTAGMVRRKGGALLQVAVNEAVITSRDEPETLIAKVTGFYDVFRLPLQPALGVGVMATQAGNEDIQVEPSLTVGVVGNFGKFIVVGGYDAVAKGADFGLAVNFKWKK